MMEIVALTSLKIVFVWAAMKPGNILYFFRCVLEEGLLLLPVKVELQLRKPLFDCLFCMGGIWGLFFTWPLAELSWDYFFMILAVAGLNYLIDFVLEILKKETNPLHEREN
jgi:hypothetical protein